MAELEKKLIKKKANEKKIESARVNPLTSQP